MRSVDVINKSMSLRNTEISCKIAIWELLEARVKTDFYTGKGTPSQRVFRLYFFKFKWICHELRTSRTKTQLAPRQFGPRVARQFTTYRKYCIKDNSLHMISPIFLTIYRRRKRGWGRAGSPIIFKEGGGGGGNIPFGPPIIHPHFPLMFM